MEPLFLSGSSNVMNAFGEGVYITPPARSLSQGFPASPKDAVPCLSPSGRQRLTLAMREKERKKKNILAKIWGNRSPWALLCAAGVENRRKFNRELPSDPAIQFPGVSTQES